MLLCPWQPALQHMPTHDHVSWLNRRRAHHVSTGLTNLSWRGSPSPPPRSPRLQSIDKEKFDNRCLAHCKCRQAHPPTTYCHQDGDARPPPPHPPLRPLSLTLGLSLHGTSTARLPVSTVRCSLDLHGAVIDIIKVVMGSVTSRLLLVPSRRTTRRRGRRGGGACPCSSRGRSAFRLEEARNRGLHLLARPARPCTQQRPEGLNVLRAF